MSRFWFPLVAILELGLRTLPEPLLERLEFELEALCPDDLEVESPLERLEFELEALRPDDLGVESSFEALEVRWEFSVLDDIRRVCIGDSIDVFRLGDTDAGKAGICSIAFVTASGCLSSGDLAIMKY
ncbi:MAG: hypothetical protein V7L14_20250 [Nostoc sp.]|uniref:hypothetical protein n=1 Tax=Nostoc sp. TaxID=1180 RepID=UPI002FF6922C